MRTAMAILGAVVLLAGTVRGSDAAYLPGGEEVKKLVEARRGKTELSKLAASMKPGTWAVLPCEVPKGLWSAPQPSKGLHIGTWSDDGHWDSRTGQFLYFGVRQARKFVAYSEETNTWRNIEFHTKENGPELLQKFGHQYSANAFDAETSRYYTNGRRYDVRADTWTVLPPIGGDIQSMTIEFHPGLNGLLNLTKKPTGVVHFFSEEKQAWSNLGKIAPHGYHTVARENPFRKEVLFAGGNDSAAVAIVQKDGTVKAMKDFPAGPLTIRFSICTVDPQSGRYLFMVPERQFYEFDADKNDYRKIDDFTQTAWPFGAYDSPLVAYIPEHGVSMWADSKVWLYKHDPSIWDSQASEKK